MKKSLILAVLVMAIVAFTASVALAGGWWLDSSSDILGGPSTATTPNLYFSQNPGGFSATPYATDNSTLGSEKNGNNPHGNFSTATNGCKSCHAVHDAGTSSWRLLKDGNNDSSPAGTNQNNECMYCHGSDGVTGLKPLAGVTTIRGEHNVGSLQNSTTTAYNISAKKIPDAVTQNLSGDLACNSCHSVHNANTIGSLGYNVDGGSDLTGMILRADPNKDTHILSQGDTAGSQIVPAPYSGTMFTTDTIEGGDGLLLTAFCADCHNKNSNWQDSQVDTGQSHIQGGAVDGYVVVDGSSQQVADPGAEPGMGCEGCHNADNDLSPFGSNFPHVSQSSKFLPAATSDTTAEMGAYTSAEGQRVDNPNRALAHMDAVCLSCHRWSTAGDGGTLDSGVGFNNSAGF